MASLTELTQWEVSIYQIETTDPVIGGDDGLSNRQGKLLANRTAYLKQQVELKAPIASPTFTGVPAVPTAAADTSTTQVASTAFVVGQAATVAPVVDGVAAVGTSTKFARQDHVHPVDTTRAPIASPTFTGVPAVPTAAVDTNTTQVASTAFVQAQIAASNLASKSISGYQKLPSGIIIQWGISGPVASGGSLDVVLPITFPNGALQAVGVPVTLTQGGAWSASAGVKDNATITVYQYSYSGAASAVKFIVFGY